MHTSLCKSYFKSFIEFSCCVYLCEINETSAQGLLREEHGSNACEQIGGIDFDPPEGQMSKISTGRKNFTEWLRRNGVVRKPISATQDKNALVNHDYEIKRQKYEILGHN